MIDLLTASDADSWIISVNIAGDDPDYEHIDQLISQCDAINLGWA